MAVNDSLTLLNEWKVFGGSLKQFSHNSSATKTPMRFSVFLPSKLNLDSSALSSVEKAPTLFYLSGLTCTDENFCQKAHAFEKAEDLGLILVASDTSPRGANVEGEDDSYDLGSGAGFYLDATKEPYKQNYQMYSYITSELLALVTSSFPVDQDKLGIFGHSMGGHGALTIALKNPHLFRSVSAFAPICHPTDCPWGEKAFSHYLADPQTEARQYDATLLLEDVYANRVEKDSSASPLFPSILIDQGASDQFLEGQLKPEAFQAACEAHGQPLQLNYREGYDHSYFFISSFVKDHLQFHFDQLQA